MIAIRHSFRRKARGRRCRCAGTSPLRLMWALDPDVVWCIRCNAPVKRATHFFRPAAKNSLGRWKAEFESIYRLWLESGDYESWARRQLTSLAAPINRTGLKLVRANSKLDGRKLYYYFDQFLDRPVRARKCPACGGALNIVQGRSLGLCSRCLLAIPMTQASSKI
jgi:hypothetical protein